MAPTYTKPARKERRHSNFITCGAYMLFITCALKPLCKANSSLHSRISYNETTQ